MLAKTKETDLTVVHQKVVLPQHLNGKIYSKIFIIGDIIPFKEELTQPSKKT